MDRDAVECMCRVAALLAKAKGVVAKHLKPDSLEAYSEIRDLLGDCQEILASQCDSAPISLIMGHVDDIMENMKFPKKTARVGT